MNVLVKKLLNDPKGLKYIQEDWEVIVNSQDPLIIIQDELEYFGIAAEPILFEAAEEYYEDEVMGRSNEAHINTMSNDSESMILIISELNWADEFDVKDFWLASVEDTKELIKNIKEFEDEFHISFGTNQYSEYDSEDILDSLSYVVIEPDDFKIVSKYIDALESTFDIIGQIQECIIENNEETVVEVDDYNDTDSIKDHLNLFGWDMTYNKETEEYTFVDRNNPDINKHTGDNEFFGVILYDYLKDLRKQ